MNSQEQQEKINQYKLITQIQNEQQVKSQLIKHDWNVEKAIQEAVKEKKTKDTILLLLPFQFIWNVLLSIVTFASGVFLFTPRITDPRVLAVEFIEKFESKYGSNHIPFFKGGYSQALEKARKDLRFMLVVLESDHHDDTDEFNKTILASPALIEFVREKNILVWAGNVDETEGHKVSYTLGATTFPFMALIALQQPVGSSTTRMSVIERYYDCKLQELLGQLEISINRHGAVMKRLLHEREQREYERQLRIDQDAAYRESLRADQEKARKQKEEQEKQRQLQLQKELELQKKELDKQKREQFIQYLLYELEQEPTGKNVAKLSFRLADGDRVVRQFSSEATLDTLYRFVQVYPLLKEKVTAIQVDRPEDYVHQYKFTIHSPYPRMEYEADETKKIKDIKSLWPSATLVVDAVDEEEEDE